MHRRSLPLESIQVASPCDVSWDEMQGTDRVRFCEQCQRSVYNLSAMNRREAEELIGQREGRLCVRLYRRHDGTVMTEDCPVGLRAVLLKAAWIAGGVAAAFLAIVAWGAAFVGLVIVKGGGPWKPYQIQVPPSSRPPGGLIMGEMCPPEPPLEGPKLPPIPPVPDEPQPR